MAKGTKKKVVKKVDKKAEPKSVQPKKEEVQKVEEPKQIKASIEKTEDAYILSTGFFMNGKIVTREKSWIRYAFETKQEAIAALTKLLE